MSSATSPTITTDSQSPIDDDVSLATSHHASDPRSTSPNDLEKGKSQSEIKSTNEKEGEFEMVGWDEGEAAK
jgi:hypothetical protein